MNITLAHDALDGLSWQRELNAADFVPLQQDWGYGETAKQFGADVSRITIYKEDLLIGLAQLTHKRIGKLLPLSLCMRGPVWLAPLDDAIKAEAYRQLQRSLRWPRYGLWMPENNEHEACRAAGLRCVMSGYHTVMLDLSQSLETLRAQLDGKWRNRLVAAESSILKIKKLASRPEAYGFILQQEAEQSRLKQYAALHPAMVPIYQHYLGEKAVLALTATSYHEPVAALICLIHSGHATYHIGWSNAEGKQQNAHNLLLWNAVERLKQRGIKWLDLGGVNTDPEGAGIARFKIGTGGMVKSLPGTYF